MSAVELIARKRRGEELAPGEIESLLEDSATVLNPGGALVARMPSGDSPYSPSVGVAWNIGEAVIRSSTPGAWRSARSRSGT